MKEEKHIECLKEVLDEIESALKDPRGLVAHQRRLAFSLSMGGATLVELYFHKHNIIKEGSKINHEWLKRKKENALLQLQQQVVSPLDSLPDFDQILDIALKIEEKRDDLAYGSPCKEETLKEKISFFLKLKELIKC